MRENAKIGEARVSVSHMVDHVVLITAEYVCSYRK